MTSNHISGLQATLENIHEEDVYELRVAAKNSAGKGKYSQSKPTTAIDEPGNTIN